LNFLIRWSWLFLIGVLAAAIPAAILAKDTQTEYRSTATLFVVVDPEASERLTNSYAEVVKIRPVLDAVRQRLSLPDTDDQLKQSINVETNFNSQIIRITAEYPDAAMAAAIANTAATVAVENIDLFVGKIGTIRVIEQAWAEPEPAARPIATRAALAGGRAEHRNRGGIAATRPAGRCVATLAPGYQPSPNQLGCGARSLPRPVLRSFAVALEPAFGALTPAGVAEHAAPQQRP
jgi:uncharacterized protein involved in exopolysaccharide biosynthesis